MKKHIIIASLIVVLCLFAACSNQQAATSEPSPSDAANSSEKTNPADIYSEAIQLKDDGDYLQSMKLFMTIYNYLDAWTQYDGLLMNHRVSVDADCIGLLTDQGTVIAVGDGASNSLSTWSNIKAISSHAYGIVGISGDGNAISTPDTTKTKWYAGAEVVDGWDNLVKIVGGTYHTLGLRSDGSVVATRYVGDVEYNKGQCNITSWSDIISIAAGSKHSLGLKADGTVVACGDNINGQCDVESWTNIVAISANSDYSAGLKSDGTVVTTGKPFFGSSVDTSSWTDVVSISIGSYHIVGLKSDGTVLATGSNNNGECDVDVWENMRCVVAGSSITVGVTEDGTVMFIGNESSRRTEVNGYNLFTGEKGESLEPELLLPINFPPEIPLYENQKILKVSETSDATVVAFETAASYDDAFAYYEKWCSDRGGYIKQPYEGGLDMLTSPMNDIKKAVTFIVTKGVIYEDGTQSDNCSVLITLQGGDSYENVSTLK